MYNDYFGFKELPFAIAPDPRYLYMTAQHRDALAHLVYGLNSEGGCILLTGEVGTGKTTICRCLLEQIPDEAKVALVLNPKVDEIELLETICDELNISYPKETDGKANSLKTYTDRIYSYLIESNRKNEKTVLIIDEAQNLDSKVLEQLRLLTNLETDQRKLLQIIILGQPELLDILAQNEMRQLAQRITARFHLQPLTKEEVKAYVSHRLAVAGQNIQLFPEASIKLLYKLSKGIPRLINILCDRALLGAYVENEYAVNPPILKKAAKEVFGELKNVEQQQKNKVWLYPLAIVASVAIIATVAFFLFKAPSYYEANYQQISASSGANINDSLAEFFEESQAITEVTKQEKNQPDDGIAEPQTVTQSNEETAPNLKETSYVSIDKILNDASNNPASAYKTLFKKWGKTYISNTKKTACKQAEALSLQCLYKHGNINSLKRHNRPAVLTLLNAKGKMLYVTLTSMDTELATVYSNETEYVVKLKDLDEYWYGQFILLWEKPEHYKKTISPGDNGEIINWINTRLTTINKSNTESIVNTYSNALVSKVKAFQLSQGLTADGIVGPVTIIHLNTQSGSDAPTLLTSPLTMTSRRN